MTDGRRRLLAEHVQERDKHVGQEGRLQNENVGTEMTPGNQVDPEGSSQKMVLIFSGSYTNAKAERYSLEPN